MLSLGGYTVAESTTQRESAAATRSAVTAAAQVYAQVGAERMRARATARTAVEDATSVRTVASASVTEVELGAITAAVAQVNTLVAQLPTTSTAPLDPAAPGAGADRAARGVVRKPVPAAAGVATATSASLASAPAAGSTPAPGAPPAAAGSPAAPGPDAPAVDAAPAPDVLAPMAPGLTGGTLARPLTHGDLAVATQSRAPADDAAPTDKLAAQIMVAVARLADVTAKVQEAAQVNMSAVQAAAATADQTAAAAAAAAKKMALRTSLDAYANGRVPVDALCPIDFAPGQQLRCDAVAPLAALNASFKAQFGADLIVSSSYRSYADQVVCSRTKGSLCATPGTSDHGRGVAVDLGSGVERFGSVQSRWMNANAGKFGWIWPEWARPTGSNPEPWQWDFTG